MSRLPCLLLPTACQHIATPEIIKKENVNIAYDVVDDICYESSYIVQDIGYDFISDIVYDNICLNFIHTHHQTLVNLTSG